MKINLNVTATYRKKYQGKLYFFLNMKFNLNAGKNMGKGNSHYIVGEIVNWSRHSRNQYGEFSKNKIEFTIRPSYTTSDHMPKGFDILFH